MKMSPLTHKDLITKCFNQNTKHIFRILSTLLCYRDLFLTLHESFKRNLIDNIYLYK